MPDSKKVSKSKPISDVAAPGKSAPSSSSKPIIVTNRPILKDPMVVGEAAATNEKISPETKTSTKSKIQPTAPEISEEPEVSDAPEVPVVEETKAASEPESPETEPQPQPETETDEVDNDKEAPGEVSEKKQVGPDTEAEMRAEAEHDASIQKLVNNKKYFVPVNAVEKRRSKRVVAVGIVLSLLLAIAWIDIALDASLIHVSGVKPITHFFSN